MRSFSKAAAVSGLGRRNMISVPTGADGRMCAKELRVAVAEAVERGQKPFLVCATAGTTVLGAFDPLPELREVKP